MQTIEELANKINDCFLDIRSFYETICEIDKLDLKDVPRYVEILDTFAAYKAVSYDLTILEHFGKARKWSFDLIKDINHCLELPFGSELDKKLCYELIKTFNNLSLSYCRNNYNFLKKYGYELKVWAE